jgi:hypothetical protein
VDRHSLIIAAPDYQTRQTSVALARAKIQLSNTFCLDLPKQPFRADSEHPSEASLASNFSLQRQQHSAAAAAAAAAAPDEGNTYSGRPSRPSGEPCSGEESLELLAAEQPI